MTLCVTPPRFVRSCRRSRVAGWLAAAWLTTTGVGLLPQTTFAAEVPQVRKVALVDLQRVLNETSQGKNARKELETSSAAKQKQLDEKRTKLEADQAKLKDLSGEAQASAAQKLERDFQELQGVYMALQQELAQQEGRLLNQIYTNCQKIVGALANELGVDLVLVRDQNTVLHAVDSLDITAPLITRYDQKFPK